MKCYVSLYKPLFMKLKGIDINIELTPTVKNLDGSTAIPRDIGMLAILSNGLYTLLSIKYDLNSFKYKVFI